MRLRLTPRALNDLERIQRDIHERNPQGARRVGDALQAALRLIAAYPQAGRARRGGVRRFPLPRHPYLIFYRVDEAAEQVEALTIRHAARDDDD